MNSHIIDKYIFKEFLKYFMGALMLLTGVALIAKVMERLPIFLEYSGPAKEILFYILLNIPYFFSIVGAPALMFSVAFVVAMFSRSRELSVLMAAGQSLFRIMVPITSFTLFFSIGLFFFNEYIAYPSYYESMNRLQILKEKVDYTRKDGRINFHGRAGNVYYHAGFYHVGNNTITFAHITEMDENAKLKRIVQAEIAIPNPGIWILQNGSITEFHNQEQQVKKFKIITLPYPEGPEYFKKIRQGFDEMNIFDIKDELEARLKNGEPYREHLVELYWHYSFPFVCFFIVFIGGIMGSRVKSGAMSMSIGISTLLTIVYYLIMFFGKSLANNGTLVPAIGAWLANIVFGIITLVTYWKSKF